MCINVDLVVAQRLNVLEAVATREQVAGEVEDVIRLVIRLERVSRVRSDYS